MNSKHLAALALALTGTLAAGAAQAGGRADVQWSVTIGSPGLGVMVGSPVYAPRVYAQPVYAQPVYAQPVYAQPVYAQPVYARPVYAQPVYAQPIYAPRVVAPRVYLPSHVHAPRGYVQPVVVVPHRGVYGAGWQRGYKDRDRHGGPDRYDRNPRWDRDGDGVPNRRDPRPDRPGR